VLHKLFFFVYFGLAASYWWTLVPLHLFLSIRDIKAKRKLKDTEIYFQLVGWGVPLLSVIIGLTTGHVGSYRGGALCLFDDYDNFGYQYGLFFGLIAVSCTIGFFFFCASLFVLITFEKSSKGIRTWKKYRTILTFCWIGTCLYVIVLADRFYNTVLTNKLTASVTNWIQCYATAFTNNEDGAASCGPTPPGRPLTGMDNLFFFALGIAGFLIVCQYCTEVRFILWLKTISTKVVRREFKLSDLWDVSDLSNSTGQTNTGGNTATREASNAAMVAPKNSRAESMYNVHHEGLYSESSLGSNSSALGSDSSYSVGGGSSIMRNSSGR